MQIWQLQKAKAQLSDVVRQCSFEPQIISLHGIEKAVVLDFDEYKKLTTHTKDLVTFFRNSPLSGLNIEFERDKSPAREIDL